MKERGATLSPRIKTPKTERANTEVGRRFVAASIHAPSWAMFTAGPACLWRCLHKQAGSSRNLLTKTAHVRIVLSCANAHSHIAGWSSLVARRAHNPKVVGSNPAPATKSSEVGSQVLSTSFVYTVRLTRSPRRKPCRIFDIPMGVPVLQQSLDSPSTRRF